MKQFTFTDLSTGMKLTLYDCDIMNVFEDKKKDRFEIKTRNGRFTSHYLIAEEIKA